MYYFNVLFLKYTLSTLYQFQVYSITIQYYYRLWVPIVQLCPTLRDPLDCSLPGSSVHGDSPSKNTGADCYALLQWILPAQGSNPGGLPNLQAHSLPSKPPGKPISDYTALKVFTREWLQFPVLLSISLLLICFIHSSLCLLISRP